MRSSSTMRRNDLSIQGGKAQDQEARLEYLPLFLSVTHQDVVILGGSDGAAAKARLLCRAGARVRLFARTLGPEMGDLVRTGQVALAGDSPTLDGLRGCRLAFDDGADAEASMFLGARASDLGLLVNTIDRPAACDFIVPAIIDRSPVVVAISTGGASPALAKLVRQRVESVLPAGLGRLARALSACREGVKRVLSTGRARLRFWDSFLTDARLDRLARCTEEQMGAQVAEEVETALAGTADTDPAGDVALVGAGPGDPGLLSLAAAQALRTADVVLHDALVSREVLDMVRKDARLISVGKRAGGAAMPQDMINRLMVTHARRGVRVVRLKGGDPFIFGRGGEEQEHLIAHGIHPRVVGGTTAALGVAATLGIPLTHRGVARSLRLVTGALGEGMEGDDARDWAGLADPETTLCLYMAGRKVAEAARGLMAGGLGPTTPVAVVWSGCTPDQECRFCTVGELAHWTGDPRNGHPVLFIVGAVVAFAPAWTASSDQSRFQTG
ncbi:siroheme synthase CysG [Rhodospirillum sp. A1_3_36]|uniref:siroheme synthase CysG n=1 Tax=Rhodospirillum sp. A1_3_36 TaxID=3391666 RepID=UPI0039A6007A